MANHFPLHGGIYALDVAAELVKAGHKVLVIVSDHQLVEDEPFPTRTILFNNGENLGAELGYTSPASPPIRAAV
jgi:hypothetical protein